ncbi:MAG TPA: FAD-dependent oxidoreductase [Candidatus Dormibacteraeota bacterium]|nr:FAD-dependent oxidoreductase [Candidatus Dormibacteraeota bacterium]
MKKIVIVGAALAGAKAAETLREEGYDGELVLIGAESERPYERPPLSKEYLRNEAGREKVYVHEESFYEANQIDLRLRASVAAIDLGAREAVLEAGGRISFDKLLLATGAAPRRLTVPGHDLEGIHYLRDLEDSDLLRERFEQGSGHIVVVGAGWIGAEMAASARQKGLDVTLLEMTEVPLQRVLGRELGEIYRDIHADHGVDFRGGVGVERFEGAGRVERVVLADGSSIDCDLVGVGVGVAPRTQMAQTSGIAVDDGVVVNEMLEAPGSPGVFAAGDVANAWHPLVRRRIRVEHWANALNQGPAAARNMLGAQQPYERVPYFFSDQYDVGMEYSGFPSDWDEVVFRGDVSAREFIAFWLQEDRVVAGMNVNVWDVTGPIQELVRTARPVDRERLIDTDVPLEEIAGALAG